MPNAESKVETKTASGNGYVHIESAHTRKYLEIPKTMIRTNKCIYALISCKKFFPTQPMFRSCFPMFICSVVIKYSEIICCWKIEIIKNSCEESWLSWHEKAFRQCLADTSNGLMLLELLSYPQSRIVVVPLKIKPLISVYIYISNNVRAHFS